MITLTRQGTYRLVDAKDKRRMLYLDDQGYIWKFAPGIGDLLLFSKHPHKRDNLIAQGLYRIYDVRDEPHFVDLQHLELSIQPSVWQGYLLLTGLPDAQKVRARIVPTNETISAHASRLRVDMNHRPLKSKVRMRTAAAA
jgi:hypothetical protein